MTNAERAAALLDNVRALKLKQAPEHPENKLGLKFFEDDAPPLKLREAVARARAQHMYAVLMRVDWNVKHAAQLLDCDPNTLYRSIRQYRLSPGAPPTFERNLEP